MINRFDKTWLFLPILILPCLVYAILILFDPTVLVHHSSHWLLAWYHGALIPDLIWEKAQYHRLLLAGLIHLDVKHLLSNLIFILLLSAYALIQLRIKAIHLWFLLYGSSIFGYFLLSFRPSAWSHGISGGLYALLAFTVLSAPLRFRKAFILILCLLALVDQGSFDRLNHLLGLALGTIYFYLIFGNQREIELGTTQWDQRTEKKEILILGLSILLVMLQCYVIISWRTQQRTSLFSQSFFSWLDQEKECESIYRHSSADASITMPAGVMSAGVMPAGVMPAGVMSKDHGVKFDEKYSNGLFYICRFDRSLPISRSKNEMALAQHNFIKSMNINQIQKLVLTEPAYQGLFAFLLSWQSHQYLLISRIELSHLLLKPLSSFSLKSQTLMPWEEGVLLKLNDLEKNDSLDTQKR